MSAPDRTPEKETLQRNVAKAQKRLDAIETAERVERHASMEGKCFRYQNSYSCPQSDDDRWWLYQRVTSVTRDGHLKIFSFEIDKNGKVFIEPENMAFGEATLGEPITLRQFQHAWKVTVRIVNQRAELAGAVR